MHSIRDFILHTYNDNGVPMVHTTDGSVMTLIALANWFDKNYFGLGIRDRIFLDAWIHDRHGNYALLDYMMTYPEGQKITSPFGTESIITWKGTYTCEILVLN